MEALLWPVASEAWVMSVGRNVMAVSGGGALQKGAIKHSKQLLCGGDPQAGLIC